MKKLTFFFKANFLAGKKEKRTFLSEEEAERGGEEERIQRVPVGLPLGGPVLGLAGAGGGGGQTYCKLGQHVGSGSHSDANHVLEPDREHAGHSRGFFFHDGHPEQTQL